jgi:hypothetical protein
MNKSKMIKIEWSLKILLTQHIFCKSRELMCRPHGVAVLKTGGFYHIGKGQKLWSCIVLERISHVASTGENSSRDFFKLTIPGDSLSSIPRAAKVA